MNPTDPDPERASFIGRALAASRLLLAGSLVAVFAFVALPTRAADLWKMDAFSAAITVRDDGSLLVQETIDAEFLQPRHGIYRYVPYKGTTTEGEKYRLGIRLISVTDDAGASQGVKETREGNDVVWRIGNPDVTLTGPKTYIITYEVRGAILRLEDRDELYWNVSGVGWDVPLPKVKATVEYPEVEQDLVQTRCYTGAYGSTGEDCFQVASPTFMGFATNDPGEPMTIAVGWPKGVIGEESWAVRVARFLASHWHFALPLLALAFYWSAWKAEGDDDTTAAIVPEYDPPKDLRPAQVTALLEQSSSAKGLAPTLVDLAVRGHLTIEEIDRKWYQGGDDYLLKRTGKAEAGLETYETFLLASIFGASDEKKVSELKDSFYRNIPEFNDAVMSSLTKKGHFGDKPSAVRAKWIVSGLLALAAVVVPVLVLPTGRSGIFVAILIFVLLLAMARRAAKKDGGKASGNPGATIIAAVLTAVILFGNLLDWQFGGGVSAGFLVSAVLSAGIIIGFGLFMPKWTPEGNAAARHAKGFKMFISKVEKYRTEWAEKENLFETVLPYALAFGLGKKWAAAFAGLQTQPPDWYVGANAGAWNAIAFESSLSSMTKSFSAAASSSPSSRGGSGGGGFSGGGFGGGGGGSW